MSSQFVKMNKSVKTGRGGFGSSQRSEVYLQFVPGQVTDVATSRQSKAFHGIEDQNAIMAKSHVKSTGVFPRLFGSDKKYIPLFRGMTDVPVIGDPVLLCTFGGVDYYMGPLNTQNSPNFNIDPFGNVENDPEAVVRNTKKDYYGESPSFVKSDFQRLEKPYIDELDDPQDLKRSYKDIHGDMMFEGRHGNSIRIGSRNQHPIFMVSNGRSRINFVESLNDSSILAMIHKGSLLQHFQFDGELDTSTGEGRILDKPFVLGSDTVDGAKRFIGSELYNYDYDNPQLIMSSKKITINSNLSDTVISSFSNILMGSGNEILLTSNNNTIIEASNIYLGKQSKTKRDDGGNAEPLVLGEQLKGFLIEVLDVLKDSKCTCQGAALPLIDSQYKPLAVKFEGLIRKLKKPNFLSDYHFIEDNEQKQ